MAKFTPYTIRELEKHLSTEGNQHDGIYVLNTTPSNDRGRQERISIAVPKPGNLGIDVVVIPSTDMPINILDQVPKDSILQSSEFRRSLRQGVLTLVNPEEGDKYYQKESNRRDLATLISMESMNMSDAQDGVIAANGVNNKTIENPRAADNQAVNLNETGINITVYSTMESAQPDEESRVIVAIKSVMNKNITDYEYILKKAKELGFKELEGRVSRKLIELRKVEDDSEV